MLHYVSPTVWAWRKYRLRGMRHAIDRILVLFPFELNFYRQYNFLKLQKGSKQFSYRRAVLGNLMACSTRRA